MANQRLQSLLEKEVSRRQFLGMLLMAVASIFGFGTVFKLLTGKPLHGSHIEQGGYGSSDYGGQPDGV